MKAADDQEDDRPTKGQWRHATAAAWLGVVVLILITAWLARDLYVTDFVLFARTGRVMLSSQWRQTFAEASVQTGPLTLLFAWAEDATTGMRGWTLALVGQVLAASVAAFVVVVTTTDPRRWLLSAGAAGVVVLLGTGVSGLVAGHPSAILVPGLWVAAAATARRHRPVVAGLAIGVAAAIEPWGVIGVAVLPVVDSWRDRVVAAVVAVGLAAVTYAPFAILGDFRLLDMRWRVSAGAPLAPLLGTGELFTWPLRVLQGAVMAGAGVAVALAARNRHVLWAAPLAAASMRPLLDPQRYGYYETPTMLLVVGGLFVLASRRDREVVPAAILLWIGLLIGLVPTAVRMPAALLGGVLAVRLHVPPSPGDRSSRSSPTMVR